MDYLLVEGECLIAISELWGMAFETKEVGNLFVLETDYILLLAYAKKLEILS
ncbi:MULTISPECIES: hypothetical protein [Enterococcus]|uniref:hypothetical protein n=1 Tax=Enterococcus TaxID=1350 RepID=UPI00189E7A76|nr:hypothetical protein [Enterococcus dispar]MCU7357231.1 hypothetical protein [Enterococcus dispar]MDT2705311.1 hypothetical protein [Enterococcus dispar]